MSKQVGYIRVSSYDQNTDRQLVELVLDKAFTDKASAKDTNRPQLQACLQYLRDGDVLHVHSIDRLARNLRDLQAIVEELNGRCVEVIFHKENLHFKCESDPMQKLMLQLMGAVAEFERSLIKERQREGIAAAKAKGKRIGAAKKLSDDDINEIRSQLAAGNTKKDIAKSYNVSRQTLYTALQRPAA